MNEIAAIINAQKKTAKKTALVTVVHVEGSSYRRPGARMLITEDGELTGAISGGCLEGDALKKALHAIQANRTMLVTYDTSDEDDAQLGLGLGCNGIIQVLIEPVDALDENNPLNLLSLATQQGEAAVLVTVFSLKNKRTGQPGTSLVVKENIIAGKLTVFNEIITSDAQQALKNREIVFKNYIAGEENFTAFLEYITGPVSLIVVGAGNDVIPLVRMAEILGWKTTVIDGRPAYAKKERFTPTCQVILAKPENILSRLTIDERTVFVLMTHNYNYDLAMLRELLTRKVAYVGSLGPQKKLNRMFEELKTEGMVISEAQRSRVYGPSGLNIGAESPEEIALSILAEIKAVLADKSGNSLRQLEVIHSREKTGIVEVRVTS